MDHRTALLEILVGDTQRYRVIEHVRSLGLADCWVGAGLVRNAVWDSLHGRPAARLTGDVDVVWFCPERPQSATDRLHEVTLRRLDPTIDWSVKNQVRMHLHNGDPPYASTIDALRYWPETATAVAVRLTPENVLEVASPFGLNDLFDLVLRPTPAFRGAKYPAFARRVREKAWLMTWPLLRVDDGAACRGSSGRCETDAVARL